MPPAVTSGFCANRSAWRVSIAGSVRSAGANNCDHCARNCGAEAMESVHLAAEIASDDAWVVYEADCRAGVHNTAGFENVAMVGSLERCAGILLDEQD